MPEHQRYLPEGLGAPAPRSLCALREAAGGDAVFEAAPRRCGADHTLYFSLGGVAAQMPRAEAVAPWISGAGREIAVLSRVGKPTCFTVLALRSDAKGAPLALLSRRAAQELAMADLAGRLRPGTVLTGRITRLESFGAFVDVGCGIAALLPLERISVSRIAHPAQRFRVGQKIRAAVLSWDPERRRITLTHRELLGTWMENASRFRPGETVEGAVRSVQPYGAFIELAPNLSGLAENRGNLAAGDGVSVYIKSIRPEGMKIKLQVVERLPPPGEPTPLTYQITGGQLERWTYSPPGCSKTVETVFTVP